MTRAVLVGTWSDGVFIVRETGNEHEFPGSRVQALTTDGRGRTLAIVDGHTLRRRSSEGAWSTLATSDSELSCCVVSDGHVYVGTNDARVFRLTERNELAPLHGFENVEGRETWTAGQALVKSRPNLVAAAAAAGLCTSRDGGRTWSIQTSGLHASYCSAVAFLDDDVLVAASEGHFARQGRIYRGSMVENAPLCPVGNGLPEWTEGIVDTHCIAVSGSQVAFADHAGNVHVSGDSCGSWSRWAHGLPSPSSVHFL